MQNETDQQQEVISIEKPDTWDALGTFQRTAWLARANRAVAVLSPMFAPRAVDLRYAGHDNAKLTLLSPTGESVDCGQINLEH